MALHPAIKHVMQDQIHEERTHDPALRGAFGPDLLPPIFMLKGSSEPACAVQQNPLAVSVMPHGFHNERVR